MLILLTDILLTTAMFSGCSIAFVVAIVVAIRARNLLEHKDRGKYMDNIFPL